MAVENGFDLSELDALNRKFLALAEEQFPKEAKKFVRRQGAKVETRLRNAYKTKVKKKTGNLIAGVERGMPELRAGSWQIRVRNTAPHAHLIEHGHVMKNKNKKPILNAMGQERWVDGKHVAADVVNAYKEVYPDEVDAFVDEMLEKGLK